MTTRFFGKPIIIIAALALLCGYLFFFQLGELGLTDPDETFYAQTAKEMANRNDWITPYLYGVPQFEKPILFYWLIEASYKILGINEFSSRLPSAVFGVIGVIAIYLLGSLMFNKRVGILAALILATNVEYLMLARGCVTDMALGVFVLLGMLFFIYGYIAKKDIFYILSAAMFGLATLTKGPIGILLPGLVIIIYLAMTKELKILSIKRILWVTLTFLAIALPWYLVSYKIHGKAFVDEFFGFQNVIRFLEPEHKIGAQFYYYLPILIGGFFPWSAFLPFGLWRVIKKSFFVTGEDRKYKLFIFLWFAVIFAFFSMSSTKLPTYIFPAWPAIALMIAIAWDDFLEAGASVAVKRWMTISYYLLLAVVALGAAGLYLFIKARYPMILSGILISGALLVLGFVISLITMFRKKYILTYFFIVYALLIFLYPFAKLVLPELERYETSKEIARELLSRIKDGERIASEKDYVAGTTFYIGREVTNVDKHHVLVNFLSSDKRVWCVLKEKNHRQLYELDTIPRFMKPSYVVYKLGKKCIITNELPADGKYLVKRERLK